MGQLSQAVEVLRMVLVAPPLPIMQGACMVLPPIIQRTLLQKCYIDTQKPVTTNTNKGALVLLLGKEWQAIHEPMGRSR